MEVTLRDRVDGPNVQRVMVSTPMSRMAVRRPSYSARSPSLAPGLGLTAAGATGTLMTRPPWVGGTAMREVGDGSGRSSAHVNGVDANGVDVDLHSPVARPIVLAQVGLILGANAIGEGVV